MTPATSPLLSRPGAVPAGGPDEGVAAHYGDPYREQRRLSAGEAVVDLSHRPVVRVEGPDRLSWLHSLTSQHLTALEPGVPTQALVLSPQGHVEHHLSLVDDGTAVLAHVEPSSVPSLVDWLDRMRFMLRVEVSLSPLLVVGRVDGWSLETSLDGVGEVAGVQAWEALRVAAGTPRLGLDTDHRTVPNETPWLRTAVHLDKGCYRGQETVARIDNLGRPPRFLALLHLDGSDSELPAPGDPLTLDGTDVGRVGSAVRHHELGPIALALVKRRVPLEADLLAGAVPARLDAVPVAVEEPRAARPSLLRF